MDLTMNEQEFVWQMMNERLNKLDVQMDKLLGHQAEQQVQLDQIDDHVGDIKAQQQKMADDMQRRFNHMEAMVKSSVPEGDLEGHRAYHAMMMRRWNWVSHAKTTVVIEVMKVVAVAGLLWFAATTWGGFKIAVGG